MIKVVSFDFDGTLADENFDKLLWYDEIPKLYAKKFKLSFEDAKKKVSSEYEKAVGHHSWTDVGFWFDKFGLGDYNQALDDLKHHIKLFPDTLPVLTKLNKKFRLVMVTNAEKKILDLKLKVDGVDQFFSDIFSAPTDFKKLKKDESVYKEILKRLNIKPDEMVHIGDSWESDYLVPKRVGINSFFLDREGIRQGENVVHSLIEFKEKLLN
jgi:HAD superfamily hydrolase (TIGR01549 family)